jgi:hypothetical protein
MCARLCHRHLTVAHVLEDVSKVLAVPVHEDAAIITHVLRAAAAVVGIKGSVWHASQCLHRRLESDAADVELDAPFLCFYVFVHGVAFAP